MANTMELQRKSQNDTTIFKLIGNLDAISAPDTGKKMLHYIDEGDSAIVMDLSDLEYISSAGLQTILRIIRRIKEVDGKLALAALSSNVADVIELSGFTLFLSIFDTVEAAIDSL